MAWEFKREEQKFDVLPEGQYRIRVAEADKAVSKNGNDMIVLKFDVSGSNALLYHYIVFMPDKPEITNRILTQFYDSFADIKEGDGDTSHWIGKVGACKVKHEDYNGNPTAKISYFLHKDKQGSLPPWKEPERTANAPKPPVVDENGFMQMPPEGTPLPF